MGIACMSAQQSTDQRRLFEGSLEVKLQTIWTDGKAEVGRVREEKGRREKIRSHVVRWEMKSCTPLWRAAHLQDKCTKHTNVRPLLEVEMSKKCMLLWREARFDVKCTKHTSSGPLLEVEMSKKCTPLWCEAHVQVKMYKTHQLRTTFGSWGVEKVYAVVARSTCRSQKCQKTEGYGTFLDVQMSFCVAGAGDCTPCQKWEKHESFVAVSKTIASVGHLTRICKDAFRMAGTVQETHEISVLGDQGSDFLRGVVFWSVKSSGLLRWFCMTGAALRMTWYHFFVAGAVVWTGGVEKSLNALVRGCQLCTPLSIFEGSLAEFLRFWCCKKMRKSCRIASLLTLSRAKKEEVSLNCCVFLCCQVQKLRKSRRIASFSSLQIADR